MAGSNTGADESEVFDFLVEYERDQDAGRDPGLAHYLTRFPGSEDAVAREYLALRGAVIAPGPTGAAVESSGDAADVGPYRLIEELGRGGQGSVWLAEDQRIARRVALKMLPPSYAALSSERRERMRREAALVSRLDHPGICPVYEAEVDGELPYIAMRFVEGETLAACIRRAREGKGFDAPLSAPPRSRPGLHRVLRYVERAARALHAAHEAGVLHRDVKPGNLMVDPQGEPIVVDFGQALDEHFDGAALTLSGEVFGTPAYMAPEQVEGKAVDRRVDVWALGACLYEALTLRSPFQRDTIPGTLTAIRDQPLQPAASFDRSIPADLEVVLATALEKDQARRYESALELAEDLRRIREYEPIHARPAGATLRLRRWTRRHPALAASLVAVFVSLSVGLGWSLHMLSRERSALRHAVGRHLAERSITLLEEDPPAALALSIEAVERAPGFGTRGAVYAALDACRLRSQLRAPEARLVTDLLVEPNSREAVTVQSDGTLRSFELESGRELRRVQLSSDGLEELRIDFERGLALTATVAGEVALWSWPALEPRASFTHAGGAPVALALDAAAESCVLVTAGGFAVYDHEGLLLREEAFPERGATLAAFSPDGGRVAIAARSPGDTTSYLAIHALAEVGEPLELRVGVDPLASLEFDPRGELLVCGDSAGVLSVFDTKTGSSAAPPVALPGPITSTRWSPDGERVAVTVGGAQNAGAWLFDRLLAVRVPLEEYAPRPVVHAAFSPDGLALVSCGEDRTIRIHDTRDGRLVGSGMALMLPIAVSYSPDGRRIVTRGLGNAAQVWYARGLPELYALRGHSGPVSWAEFHEAGELAITASEDGSARVWHTPRDERSEAGGEVACVLDAGTGPLWRASFVGDGTLALTLSTNGSARRWRLPAGEPLGEAVSLGAAPIDFDRSADGARVAIVCADGTAQVWSLDEPTPRTLPPGVERARFSPNGAELVAACADGVLRTYRSDELELLAEHPLAGLGSAPFRVLAMAFRPDGGELVVAGSDTYLHFLDPRSGARTRDEPPRVFEVESLAWSPNGAQLLVTGVHGPGAYRLLDLADAPQRRHEFNHRDDLSCAAYGPLGHYGLTASRDGSVFVFETVDGVPVSQLALHAGAVTCASFAPGDGPLRVLTASADGSARVWPVDPLPTARRRKPRELASWERARESRLAAPRPDE